jgi:uncharacterized protein YndB with AHSA1/START domain
MTAIRITRVLPAPPAVVFRALTDARQIAAWSGQSARIGTKPGGRFEMFDGWATGRVVVFRPPSRFAHTWRVDEWKPEYDNSLVEWRLSRAPRGTRVEVIHSLLPTPKEARDHKGGWVEFVLEPLAEHLKKKR